MKKFFDLQLFAADGGAGGNGGDGGTNGGTNGDGGKDNSGKGDGKDNASAGKESKGITEEEVQRRLDDAKAKWEKEYKEKAERDKKEQERLSKLSEQERAKAEMEKSRKELEDKEAELKRKELKLEMVKVLAERNIPVQFMDYLVADDNDSTLKRITTFEKAYKKAIEDGVNERLKGKAPKAGGGNHGGKGNSTGVKNSFFDAIYKNQAKR